MMNRIDITVLVILFFLMSGRVYMRAGALTPVNGAAQNTVAVAGEWEETYRWVLADADVPDREEVLMLIRHHYGNFGRLEELLHYLDGGAAYAYLSQFIFPRIGRYAVRAGELAATEMRAAPGRVLPAAERVAVEMNAVQVIPSVPGIAGRDVRASQGVVIALKNNILYDLVLAPNVEVELSIGRRWSLNTEYKCPWWLNGRHDFCYQLLSGGMEARYWLGNRRVRNKLTGYFLGAYTEGGAYDFQLKEENGVRGRYYTASGLTCGYVRRIAGCFAVEFSLGIGYLTTEYRKYTSYKEDLVWANGGRYHFIGPTKAKVSLVWHIKAGRRMQ